MAILYNVKHLGYITLIYTRSRTSYHLLIRRLAWFEERGLLTKQGTYYGLTVKGEEVIRQWTRLRRILSYTYLTNQLRKETPS